MKIFPDLTVFPLWVIFMLSLWVLNHFVFKPTLAILAERRKRTTGLEKEVAYFQEQAELKSKKYELLMAEAGRMARADREQILKAAGLEQKQLITEARQKVESELVQIKDQIREQTHVARQNLRLSAESLSEQIVKKLISEQAT